MQEGGKVHLVDEGDYYGYEKISACSTPAGNTGTRYLSWQTDANLCGRSVSAVSTIRRWPAARWRSVLCEPLRHLSRRAARRHPACVSAPAGDRAADAGPADHRLDPRWQRPNAWIPQIAV